MSPKHAVERPKEIAKRLESEGWQKRGGKGDHVNFTKTGRQTVTIDMGVREIPRGTLRAIYRIAGWKW